jgi:hypothetical protein
MKFDVYDWLLIAGFLIFETGLALWSLPLALVVFGLLLMAATTSAARNARPAPAEKKN